ncbi:MAG: flagellar protein FlgN [Desulfobacterota bacterium]|nr:flagellar protein FlgN [Thermodesulfobacteriota bacterium]
MQALLDDLHKLLHKQIDLYSLLYGILRREHDIILSASIDDLHANNKKKEVVILQIKLLDESCAKVIEKLSRHDPQVDGLDAFERLLARNDDPHIADVRSSYCALRSVVRDVRELNAANERLIKGSLRAIMSSISFLTQCAESGVPCYESNGQLKVHNMAPTLLREEA